MKPKLVVLVVVLLLVAMIPALVMAGSGAKPSKTFTVVIDRRLPIGPQLAGQLGTKPDAPVATAVRPVALGIQPRAVQVLLNEGFEGAWPAGTDWQVNDFSGFGNPTWGATDFLSKRGQQSAWSSGDSYNPAFDYYENYTYAWAEYPMDLSNATKGTVRFQFLSDTEYFYDAFLWCGSPDFINYYCSGHTGSTNNKWRLVNMNFNNVPGYGSILGEANAGFALILYSDSSISDRGAFVDALRIRATGPNN
jgi:hypothetical protein